MANRIALTQPRSQLLYAYPLAVLKDNPISYGRGNEASGPTWNDLSPNKNNGTYNGNNLAYQQQSIFTSDPSTGFLARNLAGNVSLPLFMSQTTDIALEGIFKIPDALQFGGLMGVGNLTSNGWAFGVGGSTLQNAGAQLIAANVGVAYVQSGFFLTPGTWYHIAVVLTGGNFLFYVAGALFATISAGGAITTPTGNCWIGNYNGHGPNAFYSDNAFYNYALNATKIANHAILAQ